jgi:myo-inositol-1(or 4)-monophosphatase
MAIGSASVSGSTAIPAADSATLAAVVDAVHDAGARLLELYSPRLRPASRSDMFTAVRRNEETSLAVLRPALARARPQARWMDDDQQAATPPAGEWWTVDAVEGNVNHVHGLPEWCVAATLLRGSEPAITAVYQPVGDLTYTAIRGAGAHLNGQALRTSAKSDLAAAIVTTGQAEAGQNDTYRRIGDSITAMLSRALLVRATVPSTFPLLLVTAGHYDVFWQYEPVLPGVAAGALLATEAGGVVSDVHGQPWRPGSPDILVTAPGLHAAAIQVLSTVA